MSRVVEGGRKDIRLTVMCAVAIFHEEKGVLIGGIEVGLYRKLTRADLDRSFG